MLQSKFFLLFANARWAGTLLIAECPAPGTHRVSNARDLPGRCSELELACTLIIILSLCQILCRFDDRTKIERVVTSYMYCSNRAETC